MKAGGTLTLAQAEVFAEKDGQLKLVAFLTATLMAMEDRDGARTERHQHWPFAAAGADAGAL